MANIERQAEERADGPDTRKHEAKKQIARQCAEVAFHVTNHALQTSSPEQALSPLQPRHPFGNAVICAHIVEISGDLPC